MGEPINKRHKEIMKKVWIILMLSWSTYTVSMKSEIQPETYLDLLPQELQKELVQFTTHLRGHKDIVKMLLNKGANVNTQDGNGYTALIWAAAVGSKDIVEMLINAGVDVNAKDNNGKTALMYAADYGDKEIIELLKSTEKRIK